MTLLNERAKCAYVMPMDMSKENCLKFIEQAHEEEKKDRMIEMSLNKNLEGDLDFDTEMEAFEQVRPLTRVEIATSAYCDLRLKGSTHEEATLTMMQQCTDLPECQIVTTVSTAIKEDFQTFNMNLISTT